MGITGLSPRVRGNRPSSCSHWCFDRSIPACTGKPRLGSLLLRRASVYPRVYGETSQVDIGIELMDGLSPRVRGNLHLANYRATRTGSIPACTGKSPRVRGNPGAASFFSVWQT